MSCFHVFMLQEKNLITLIEGPENYGIKGFEVQEQLRNFQRFHLRTSKKNQVISSVFPHFTNTSYYFPSSFFGVHQFSLGQHRENSSQDSSKTTRSCEILKMPDLPRPIKSSPQPTEPLKIDPWKGKFLWDTTIFRGYVGFRKG